MPKHDSWNGPLTANQLLAIIATVAVLIGAVMIVRWQSQVADHRAQVSQCLAATWNESMPRWDCEQHPTGYPK